jgi:hypothetical protein
MCQGLKGGDEVQSRAILSPHQRRRQLLGVTEQLSCELNYPFCGFEAAFFRTDLRMTRTAAAIA